PAACDTRGLEGVSRSFPTVAVHSELGPKPCICKPNAVGPAASAGRPASGTPGSDNPEGCQSCNLQRLRAVAGELADCDFGDWGGCTLQGRWLCGSGCSRCPSRLSRDLGRRPLARLPALRLRQTAAAPSARNCCVAAPTSCRQRLRLPKRLCRWPPVRRASVPSTSGRASEQQPKI
uniref:ADAM_CR_2 domain-containing protein n=1 Tax=Macrostomum lignano TaxID=282301 RepID=A0A1I8F3I9_9PLAT